MLFFVAISYTIVFLLARRSKQVAAHKRSSVFPNVVFKKNKDWLESQAKSSFNRSEKRLCSCKIRSRSLHYIYRPSRCFGFLICWVCESTPRCFSPMISRWTNCDPRYNVLRGQNLSWSDPMPSISKLIMSIRCQHGNDLVKWMKGLRDWGS